MKKVTEAEVYKLLVRIGVSAGYTGIDYIIRAVFAINAGKVDNLGEVYDIIAKEDNIKSGAVERNIRTAINRAYEHRPRIFSELFSIDSKPTNKLFYIRRSQLFPIWQSRQSIGAVLCQTNHCIITLIAPSRAAKNVYILIICVVRIAIMTASAIFAHTIAITTI